MILPSSFSATIPAGYRPTDVEARIKLLPFSFGDELEAVFAFGLLCLLQADQLDRLAPVSSAGQPFASSEQKASHFCVAPARPSSPPWISLVRQLSTTAAENPSRRGP